MTIEGKAKKGATYLAYEDTKNQKTYKTLIKFATEGSGPGKSFVSVGTECPAGTCTSPDFVQASTGGQITPTIVALPAKIEVKFCLT